MLIKSVLSRLSSAVSFGRGKGTLDAAARKTVNAVTTGSTAVAASGSQLRDILAQYDVTAISPQSFSEMLQRLRQTGLISDKDYQELSTIRQDLDREGVGANQRVNLVDRYAKKLQSLEQGVKDSQETPGTSATAATDAAAVRRRLDWLKKLAAIHASPESATINALA